MDIRFGCLFTETWLDCESVCCRLATLHCIPPVILDNWTWFDSCLTIELQFMPQPRYSHCHVLAVLSSHLLLMPLFCKNSTQWNYLYMSNSQCHTNRQCLSNEDCLEINLEDYQNCSVLCCVQQLCICTHEQFLSLHVGLGLDFLCVCVFWIDLAFFVWFFG